MTKQVYYKNNLFQQLKGFCYTVQTGSMSSAAKKKSLSQGAVSLQIQSLEDKLGVSLFKREKNKATLTKEGSKFYTHAAPHIYGTEELLGDFIKALRQERIKTTKIRIAANHASICQILPRFIKKFGTAHSKVSFEIKNISREEALKKLQNDEVDMLLYSMRPDEVPSDLDFIPIVEYKPILLMNKSHPLAKKKKVTMLDIKRYDLLRLDKKFITIPNFDEIAKCYGLKTKIEFEMANYEILKKFVKEGVGIAILAGICLEGEDREDLIGKSLANYFPGILYGILVKKGKTLHGLLKDFVEMLRTEKLLQIQIEQK